MDKKVEDECPNCEETVRLHSLKPTLSEEEIAYYECPYCGARLKVKPKNQGMTATVNFVKYRGE